LTTLHHTGFAVEDLDRSVRFYTEGLGLERYNRVLSDSPGISGVVGHENASLDIALLVGVDGHTLEIIQYLNPVGEPSDPESQRKRARFGAAHLCFVVQDIEATYSKLLGLGGTKLNPPVGVFEGLSACYLQDPDGNWLELIEDEAHKRQPFTIRQNLGIPAAPEQ
jgi:catechol 2,3-dioxygenase-like lactoylglutathione lyase family enzyme